MFSTLYAHLCRHAIGYCTILASVVNVVEEKLQKAWPISRQEWFLLGINVVAAFLASVIAYLAIPRGPQPPIP